MSHAKPRILFVGHTAAIGGPSLSLLLLMRHLRERYDVSAVLPESGPVVASMTASGLRSFVVPGLRLGAVPAICRLIRREEVDLVYGNNPSGRSRNALIAARLTGTPFIWHFRGMKWHWSWRKGLPVRLADAVVAVSHACGDSLKRFCSSERLNIVYNGVEQSSAVADRERARQYLTDRLGLPADALVLISVGHLMARKGHAHAVEAVAAMASQVDNVHLLIVGSLDRDVAYTAKIRELIRRHHLDRQVHLLGLRDDVPWLLSGSDMLVHAAVQDPHPRAVLEGMAAGLPVVAFAADGVAETVVHGDSGWLLPTGDVNGMSAALLWLLGSPERRHALGRSARQRVETHFSASATAARTAEIIDRVLAARSGVGMSALPLVKTPW